jgi:hypothetical protein
MTYIYYPPRNRVYYYLFEFRRVLYLSSDRLLGT